MSQVVLLVVFHQCVKPPEETRRYVAIPRSSVSKVSVKPLEDCNHGLPAGRLATSQVTMVSTHVLHSTRHLLRKVAPNRGSEQMVLL